MKGPAEVAITIDPLIHECPVCLDTLSEEDTVACKGKVFLQRFVPPLEGPFHSADHLDNFVDNSVSHRFCKVCVRQHAERTLNDFTMLDPHATGLRCTETGCTNALSLDDIAVILPEATFSLLASRLREDQAALKRRLENADQIDGDIKDQGEVGDANRRILASAISMPLPGLDVTSACVSPNSCILVKTLRKSEPDVQPRLRYGAILRLLVGITFSRSEEQLSKVFIRRCPDCHRSIVKTMGCNFVKCPCGTGLCCVCSDRHRLKCNLLCDYKASLVRDRSALKKLYDGATPAQRTHLRSIHAGIEHYGSFRYKCRDYLREHVNGILLIIFFCFSALVLLQVHARLGVSLSIVWLILAIEGFVFTFADLYYRYLW